MLFPSVNAKYILSNIAPQSTDTNAQFTSSPLNLQFNFDITEPSNIVVLGGISRTQQANTASAKNALYRLMVGDYEISAANTGFNHIGLLRKPVLLGGLKQITSPGTHNVRLEVYFH